MRIFNPPFRTRRRLVVALTVAGAVAGGVFGLILTRLGKVAAGAPPATWGNYAWNAAVFGLLSAVVSPVVSWSTLRRAPLWRTVVEPLVLAVVGGSAAVFTGIPVLLLVLPPVGLALGFADLQHRYPDPDHAIARPLAAEEPAPRITDRSE